MTTINRGGKREGAGRPALGITKKVSITLDEGKWEQIEKLKEEQQVSQSALLRFVIEDYFSNQNQKESDERSSMWWELMRKNIFENYVEIKESQVKECIQHWKYPNEFKKEVWQRCKENSKAQGYKKIGVKLLLDSFLFEGKQLPLDKNFESLEEQITFSIIRYVWINDQ